jgi:hypothetical protein
MILQLYPAEHRALFASEMLEAFEHAAMDWRKRGSGACVYFAARELLGLLSGLFKERFAKWKGGNCYVSSRCLSRKEPNLPTEVVEIERRLQRLIGCMEFAIAHHDFPKARRYCDEERVVREQLHRVLNEYKLKEPIGAPVGQKTSNGYA